MQINVELKTLNLYYVKVIFIYYIIFNQIAWFKMTLIKTKQHIKIARKQWEEMKSNPLLSEVIEILEDIHDLEKSKKTRGKSVTINQYRKKRGI